MTEEWLRQRAEDYIRQWPGLTLEEAMADARSDVAVVRRAGR